LCAKYQDRYVEDEGNDAGAEAAANTRATEVRQLLNKYVFVRNTHRV